MAESALHWCPERRGVVRSRGATSRFWNNWRSRTWSQCVILFSNHWNTSREYQLAGDENIELRFEITGGSDCPSFRLSFKHRPTDQVSSFSYLAWSQHRTSTPRPEVEHPDIPPPGQYTFSSFLMDVEFQRKPSFSPQIDALRTWPDQDWNYPLQISWKSDESPIGINVNLATDNWSASSRAKLDTWKILRETGAKVVIAAAGSGRLEECWSFFASQPSPTLPPWWRYANPVHQNQTVIQELPSLAEGSELSQYHQKRNEDNLLIVPMVHLDHYLTPIEYEVFGTGSLLRGVESARDAYNGAFNRSYQFTLDPTDIVFPQRRGSESYFVRLQVEPWMSSDDDLPFASGSGTDVTIRTHDSDFSGRVLSVEGYVLVMEVRRTVGRAALILNEQRGHFRFGNPDPPFVVVRQAIRGVMWGRVGIPEDNWLKRILLAHENLAMQRQSIGTSRPHPTIQAHQRLNSHQKEAFLRAISFGESPRARLTIIEGSPGTGKTAVLLALIIRAMACKESILICAETNVAVRSCASVLMQYLKDRNLPSDGVRMVQRDTLEALSEGGGYQNEEELVEESPEYMDERMRLQLVQTLEREADMETLSLTGLIARRIRFLQDPDPPLKYSEQERTILHQLEMSRKAILRMSVTNEASTEQSTKLRRYQSVSRVVDDNEEECNVNIRKAQREFDKCWRTTCQYYIGKHTLVVFVTAATATTKLLKDFRPSTIVIDEASQMAEIATVSVVATFFQSVQKLVLAGDLMQNSPFVGSDNRNEFASTTERSLMERMMITGVPSAFLSTQYRMHPDISDTISRHFCQGRLVDAPNVSGRIEEGIFRMFLQRNLASCTRHSVFFHIAESRMYVSKKGGSKVNPQYVAAAQQLISALIAAGAPGDAIGLLTFYKAQLQIHQVLSPPLVNVTTVNACQGREFDYVVVDTVSPGGQDFSLGFLTDPKKINVALSRAKHGLIVVGSKEMGKGPRPNRGAKIWDDIIQDHLRQGSFSTMTVDSRRIEEQFSIPGEHYASARRDGHG